MANLSNINGKFVVEQTTGYVGIGITDPAFPLEVKSASAELALNATGASIYRLKSDSTDYFRINKNGVGDRLVISGGGDVGIGTSTPGSRFDLGTSSGTSMQFLYDTSQSYRNTISNYWNSSTDSRMDFNIGRTANVAPVTIMSVGYGGNVGIGTTSPDAKLAIGPEDTTNELRFLVDNDGSGVLGVYNDGQADNYNQEDNGYVLQIGTRGGAGNFKSIEARGECILASQTGNIGIGRHTGTPAAKLDILGDTINIGADNGSWTARTNSTTKVGFITAPHYTNAEEDIMGMIMIGLSTANEIDIGGGTSSYNAATDIKFFTAANNTTVTGTERMRLASDGSVRIGKSTNYSMSSPYLMIGNAVNTNELILSNQGTTQLAGFDGSVIISTGGSNNLLISSDNGYTAFGYGVSNGYTSYNEAMRITSAGNVGIGTATPNRPLTIQSNSGATAISIYARVANDYGFIQFFANNQTTLWSEIAGRPSNLSFYQNSTEVLRLGVASSYFPSGDVGIGTTTPNEKLEVTGNIRIDSRSKAGSGEIDNLTFTKDRSDAATGTYEMGAIRSFTTNGYSGGMTFYCGRHTGGGSYALIPTMTIGHTTEIGLANVGIGTTAPTATLEVQESGITVANTQAFVASFIGDGYGTGQVAVLDSATIAANVGGEIQFGGKYTGNTLTEWASIGGYKDNATDGQYGGYFTIKTRANGSGQTERMRITSSGFLKASNYGGYYSTAGSYHELVSNATGNWLLHMYDSAADPYGIRLKYSASPNNTHEIFYFDDGTQQRYYVTSAGAVYGNGTYGTISDIKLKENIVDATPKLDDINKLKVRNFNFKDKPEEKHIGFIAQELEEVFPKAIENTQDRDDDGKLIEDSYTKTIKSSILIPMLVKSIQELKAEIELLKSK